MNEFYTISFLHQDFLKRYSSLLYIPDEDEGAKPHELCKMLKQSSSWTDNDIAIGITKVTQSDIQENKKKKPFAYDAYCRYFWDTHFGIHLKKGYAY